jgi:hypothetical protein
VKPSPAFCTSLASPLSIALVGDCMENEVSESIAGNFDVAG